MASLHDLTRPAVQRRGRFGCRAFGKKRPVRQHRTGRNGGLGRPFAWLLWRRPATSARGGSQTPPADPAGGLCRCRNSNQIAIA